MFLHKPQLLLDLDEIYTIPEGSSLRNIFFWGGGLDERYMCMFIMLWLSSFLLSVYKIVEHGNTVFSLNFSSAGKGPFMDGKAKNIYFSKRGGGGAVE